MTGGEFNAKTIRDFNEQFLFGDSIEECTADVHLLDVKIFHCSNSKEKKKGGKPTRGSKGVIGVNAFNLPEARAQS
jgi:hypothetical protein